MHFTWALHAESVMRRNKISLEFIRMCVRWASRPSLVLHYLSLVHIPLSRIRYAATTHRKRTHILFIRIVTFSMVHFPAAFIWSIRCLNESEMMLHASIQPANVSSFIRSSLDKYASVFKKTLGRRTQVSGHKEVCGSVDEQVSWTKRAHIK